jgi:hypothetical protein
MNETVIPQSTNTQNGVSILTDFGTVGFSQQNDVSGKFCKGQCFSKFDESQLLFYEDFPKMMLFRKVKIFPKNHHFWKIFIK